MTSPIRSIKDFLTGLIYLTIGSGAIIIALVGDYNIGTALKMGPAYFPLFLSMLLVLVGIISLVRSFITPGTSIGSFSVKGLLLVVASTVLFGLVVRGAGLIIALPLLVLVSSWAGSQFRWGPAIALAAGLTVFCILVFLKGLGVPLPILGSWFGG